MTPLTAGSRTSGCLRNRQEKLLIARRSLDSSGRHYSKRAGILLGLGLGGFADGILLHQIIHWHNMGSAVVPPTTMEIGRAHV